MRLALAQMNPTVGDLEGNARLIEEAAGKAADASCDLLVFPQMALSGYPLEGLAGRKDFLSAVGKHLRGLAKALPVATLVGFPQASRGRIYSACALVGEGQVLSRFRMDRRELQDAETVLDDLAAGGKRKKNFTLGGTDIEVCFGTPAPDMNAGLAVVLAADPFAVDIAPPDMKCGIPACYVNLAGAQDGVVFRGGSSIYDGDGNLMAGCKLFEPDFLSADVPPVSSENSLPPFREPDEDLYEALVVGIRDFVRKNGFEKGIVGVSGGIDSALVLAVTVDALGPGNVTAVSMPSSVTSNETRTDGETIAGNLVCQFQMVDIAGMCEVLKKAVPDAERRKVTVENLQARVRGVVLMTMANATDSMVIATGNRSEAMTGYCTLYGDTVGACEAIGDIPKMKVYDLARLRNRSGGVIPESVLERAPTAELSPGQTDQDSLPPYPELDAVLEAFLDEGKTPEDIAKDRDIPLRVVKEVLELMRTSEYKRRQCPRVIRVHRASITSRLQAPITNQFRCRS